MSSNIDCTDPEIQRLLDAWSELGCRSFCNAEALVEAYEQAKDEEEVKKEFNRLKSMHKLPKGTKKYF